MPATKEQYTYIFRKEWVLSVARRGNVWILHFIAFIQLNYYIVKSIKCAWDLQTKFSSANNNVRFNFRNWHEPQTFHLRARVCTRSSGGRTGWWVAGWLLVSQLWETQPRELAISLAEKQIARRDICIMNKPNE